MPLEVDGYDITPIEENSHRMVANLLLYMQLLQNSRSGGMPTVLVLCLITWNEPIYRSERLLIGNCDSSFKYLCEFNFPLDYTVYATTPCDICRKIELESGCFPSRGHICIFRKDKLFC